MANDSQSDEFQELPDLAAGLDAHDFDVFYKAHYRALLRLAFVLTGKEAVADDLVQDAFEKASRRWEKVSQMRDPIAWIRRVVINSSNSRGRRLKAEMKALTRIGTHRDLPDLVPDARLSEVWTAVRKLPDRQREVLVLFAVEQCTIAEIAEVLTIKEPTVRTHLERARAKLSAELRNWS